MKATLYSLAPSPPGRAVDLMLDRKGIDHKVVNLLAGTQPIALRPLGFRRGTVPAMKLAGKRVQGSRAISRYLDEVRPEPRLFPEDPQLRILVEEAERWGDDVLQPIPRRLTRWIAKNDPRLRVHMAAEAGLPLPRMQAAPTIPIAWWMARKVGADDTARVERSMNLLPAVLDHVEELLSDGVIGGKEPNAADFQIAPNIRSLISFADLATVLERRKAGRWALAMIPAWPTSVPAGLVPDAWVEPLRASA